MSDCLGSPATVWREKYSSYPTYKEGETHKIKVQMEIKYKLQIFGAKHCVEM
jgi:hypothetical protein